MKYVHTNIISNDWRRLAKFYADVFECVPVPPERRQYGEWLERGTGLPGAELQGAHLRLPGYDTSGPTLEIYQYSSNQQTPVPMPNQTGLGHLAFEVDNVKAIRDQVLANGGATCGDITSHAVDGVGTITFVYMRDPDGNLIELQNWD